MISSRASSLLAAAVLTVGVLSGCGQPDPDPAGTTPPATTPPAATSTPEPAPTSEPSSEVDPDNPNVIEEPADGSTVTGPQVTVRGEGTAFEAHLDWRVVEAGTDTVVEEGYTMAGANGEIGPFELTVDLEPGEYTVEVWEPDVSDGASGQGPFVNLVAATFTVE